jgi:hypothetical protein
MQTRRLVCILALVAVAAVAQADVLYNIDFGSPPHTVGEPPVEGGGPPPRATISDIRFGTPLVVTDLGPLVDQPLRFEYGDQIALQINDLPLDDDYALECDLVVVSVSGRFAIFFDAPSIRRISFKPDGTIDLFPQGDVIGTYEFDTLVHMRVEVDLDADTWVIYLDDVMVYLPGRRDGLRRTFQRGVRHQHHPFLEPVRRHRGARQRRRDLGRSRRDGKHELVAGEGSVPLS